jgi:hypothetical protein
VKLKNKKTRLDKAAKAGLMSEFLFRSALAAFIGAPSKL